MESPAFIISCLVRMDLHFKCMLNVMAKLELIDTFRNVAIPSHFMGDDRGFALLEFSNQMVGVGACSGAAGTALPYLCLMRTSGKSSHPSEVPLPTLQEERIGTKLPLQLLCAQK